MKEELLPQMDSPFSTEKSRIEKFIRRVISPAIIGKTCPICLRTIDVRGAAVLTVCSHAYCLDCIRKWSDLRRKCPLCNSIFDSWFYRIDLFSLRFLKQQLPALPDCRSDTPRPPSTVIDRRRVIERSRREINSVNRRSRPLPWRRSFGRAGTVSLHVIAERKLQWRASVYNRRLQAVPMSHGISSQENVPRNAFDKERIMQRIEPWIRRELQAILGDPDPSIILHVVSSLLFSGHERKFDGSSSTSSRQLGLDDNFLAPLEPFLHDRTNMFWHELRCFVESSFTMETYDAVIEYRQLE
ncbi:E3 ubiquitin-protein ligase Topors [Hibiscus syriacus]|uniref:E3 ubiquitin-protein ligase Topors n=1 Tax=Hibiscus syriacus TaxID=106335 RepID=UPI0019228716|nr:E3 ubiquitin-protein ligase Topors [Hibiscus syriacus]